MKRTMKLAVVLSVPIWLLTVVSAPAQSWKELLDRADSLSRAANYDSALAIGRISLEEAEAQFGESDTIVALVLDQIGVYHYYLADYDQAESVWKRALAIREEALGSDHPDVAKTLNNLASLYDDEGRYAESETLHKRALTIREKILGPQHPDVAASLINLGNLYYHQGRYNEGITLHKRALAFFEKALGPDHPNVASSMHNLADLYFEQGRYSEAEPLYERAIAISKKNFGSDHPYVGLSLNNLANLYYEQGKYDQAEPLLKRALAIFKTNLGPEHPFVGYSLNGLADLYHKQGRYDEAETLYIQAQRVSEKNLGPDHPEVAYSLNKLAELYRDQEKYSEAEPLLKRALSIFEKAVGSNHPDVAMGLNNLANLYRDQNRYSEAEPLYWRALETFEKALGPHHPKVALCLESFSYYLRLQGKIQESLKMAERAFKIRQENFRDGSSVMSEKDALIYSQFMRNSAENYVSIFLDLGSVEDSLVKKAVGVIFSSKGQVSDEIFARYKSVLFEADTNLLLLVDSLRQVRFQLSRLYIEGPDENHPESYRPMLDSLSQKKETLESELARKSASFRREQELREVSVQKILTALPQKSVLVEYLKYSYHQLQPDSLIPHYLVITAFPPDNVFITDLGKASEIEPLIDRYRRHLLNISKSGRLPSIVNQIDYQKINKSLYEKIWKPVEKQISNKELVLIAPDGGLNLVSFAGLLGEEGKYLIEKYPIHYLSSGRDLIRLGYETKPGSGLFALGDPDYNAPASVRLSRSKRRLTDSLSEPDYHPSGNVSSKYEKLKDLIVSPLPGTRSEVEKVALSFRKSSNERVVTYFGPDASEEHFKDQAPGNRVIHLATHGYFIQGKKRGSMLRKRPESAESYAGENPLLLSGLFLAGANLLGKDAEELGAEDGILTAEEVTGMNLDGTELVVLSACETGLGKVREGEGVYGLRRAFQMAGARTVISALWPVSDKATAEKMSQLYGSSGKGSLPEMMREIQLKKIEALRKNKQVDHPFSWGAFIALGDWRKNP